MMRVTTTCLVRRRWGFWLFSISAFLLFLTTSAWGLTDIYQLSKSTGTATDMSGSTQIFGAYQSNSSSSLTNIGFDFYFDGTRYTTFSVTPSGLMAFGTRPYATYYPYYWPNSSTMNSSYPAVCAYWGRYFYPGSNGKVHYKVTGTAPNRQLTVEWLNVQYFGSSSVHYGTYQVRIYERTNNIEFYYGNMSRPTSSSTTYSAAIGIASSNTRYINVYGNDFPTEVYTYPSGQYYTYYRAYADPITNGTIYTFSPCVRSLTIVGDVVQGGTDEMAEGDEILLNQGTMRGDNELFHPFSLVNPDNGCNNVSYTMSVTGDAAGDYSVPTSGVVNVNQTFTPDILFTPQAIGPREATLTINFSNGERISYTLKATGITRMNWVGAIGQGGTSNMDDGDQLMTGIELNRGMSQDFSPFTITNINLRPGSQDAEITYTLDDPLGEYALSLGNSTGATLTDFVASGESSTPTITFAPHRYGAEYGTGPQAATLTVTADGEVRVFTLNGFSVAPAAEFYFKGTDRVIGSDRSLFSGLVSCVGESATTVQLTVENVNRAEVLINTFEVYMMDGRIQAGSPPYPLETNVWGQIVPSSDYIITEAPGVAPTTANAQLHYPLIIRPGETKTYYLTFVAQRTGKRYARVFMRTNCVNFFSEDINNYLADKEDADPTEGLMTMEFFGKGVGGALAKNAGGLLNGLAITFDPVKLGNSGNAEATIFNTGECDMRVGKGDIRPTTGDVNDFELTEVFNGLSVDANGDVIIPPGGSATIKARFMPSRSGSRRASVLLRTSDSMLITEGVTERGVYYLDLYGVGKADLYARDVQIRPAVIDGPSSRGVVHVENSSTEIVDITGITLSGANTNEIVEDPANPWPQFPIKLSPGESIDFGVAFSPLSGSAPGLRQIMMDIAYNSSDVASVQIHGIAGSRLLTVAQASLFEGFPVAVGTLARQTAVITNGGTFPVTLSSVAVEGVGKNDYSFNPLPRITLDPGGSEFIEITYAPSAAGPSSATLVFKSNSTNGDRSIALGGVATGTSPIGNPSGLTGRNNGGTGAARSVISAELLLAESVPNPARDVAEISYSLPESGATEMKLYDARGLLVRSIVEGEQPAGLHTVQVNVADLTSGVYVYVLRQNGKIVTHSMRIIK